MREAIRDQLARFAEEVRDAPAEQPESEGGPRRTCSMLVSLHVDQTLMTASQFLETLDAAAAQRDR